MNRLLLAVVFMPSLAQAADLVQLKNPELATALALSEKLSEKNGIRVFAIQTVSGECWGKLSSCPDVRLLVAVEPDVLYKEPALYELPKAKGWKFVDWKGSAEFVVRTTIPDANVDQEERKKWRPVEYRIHISEKGARYEMR